MRTVMGFDIGGGSGRCLLLDVDSGRSWHARRQWPEAASGLRGAGQELDLEAVFASLVEAAREVKAKADGPEVMGLAAAGMRFGTIVLDGDGGALLAATNRDARAAAEAMAWAAEDGPAWQVRTGHWPAPILTAARLRWMRAQAPADLDRAAHVLSLNEWLAWRLCGEAATDPSQAGVTGMFDLAANAWTPEFDFASGILPEVRASGSRLGVLAPAAAEALGLAAGIPVAVGGGDTQCALLGMGALAPGRNGAVCGTTMPLQRVLDERPADPEGRLWFEPHVVPGCFVAESNAGATGECLDWLGHALFPDAPHPAARLLAEASEAAPGANGMLSTFGAQVMHARAMALPVGDLTLSHLLGEASEARAALARSVVEGMAFAVRANLEQVAAVGGPAQGALALGGGMARSRFWAEMLADVLEQPVAVAAEPETTALGAGFCAAVGAGLATDVAEAAERWAATREVAPDAARGTTLRAAWPRWQELRASREASMAIVQGHAIQAFLANAGGSGGTAASAGVRPRILVTADLDPEALAQLRTLGEVAYESFRDVGRLLTRATLVEALQGFQVFVTEIDLVDGSSLLELPDLRVVATCRGDAVNVDVEACTRCGIPVLHAPGRNADAVADLTLAFMLGLARKLPEANRFLRDPSVQAGDMGAMGRAFGTLRGRELWGKTVGLVGLGAVGRKVAERVRPFGARVVVYDPWIAAERVTLAGAEAVGFEELLARSDIVSLHAAVTDASEGLIDASALARMKPGGWLVNTARAALVDEDALAEALASGHLGGAALDVFSEEPPGPEHPLLRDNVIATPHVGGNTVEIGAHQGRIVGSDLARLLAGGTPRHVLNREVLPGFALDRERPVLDEAARQLLRERPAPAVTDLQKKKNKKSPKAHTEKGKSTTEKRVEIPSEPVPTALRDGMARLLEAFTASFAADPAVATLAEGKDVLLRFRLSDLGLAFWLGLRDGAGDAGVADLAEAPDVELAMRAVILDGMLSGTVNATQEAMNGGISFSGDAGKAMTLQQLQPDLERLYRAARERVGVPFELEDPATPEGGAAG
jgi:autoinducer 2 (AI-2) kinase